MKNLKRVLALVTVFAMVMSVSAFAHDWQYDSVISGWETDNTAEADRAWNTGSREANLEETIAAIDTVNTNNEAATIRMTHDEDLDTTTSTVKADFDLTIEGQGYTITGNTTNNNGTVKVDLSSGTDVTFDDVTIKNTSNGNSNSSRVVEVVGTATSEVKGAESPTLTFQNGSEILGGNRGINVTNTSSGNTYTLNIDHSTISALDSTGNAYDDYDEDLTGNYSRGINFGRSDDVTINVTDSTIQGYFYALNNMGYDNTSEVVNIENSTVKGRCVVNAWGTGAADSTTWNITNSNITGINGFGGGSEGFATVVLNTTSSGNTVNINDSTFTTSFPSPGDTNPNATEYLLSTRSANNNKVIIDKDSTGAGTTYTTDFLMDEDENLKGGLNDRAYYAAYYQYWTDYYNGLAAAETDESTAANYRNAANSWQEYANYYTQLGNCVTLYGGTYDDALDDVKNYTAEGYSAYETVGSSGNRYTVAPTAGYTVTFDVDGTETEQKVEYGKTPVAQTPTKDADAQYTYEFATWDKELSPVTGDVTYTARFDSTINKYTVTFIVNGAETEQEVEYGTIPTAPADPADYSDGEYNYTFAGWDKTISPVTGNVTYTATYTATPIPQPEPDYSYDDYSYDEPTETTPATETIEEEATPLAALPEGYTEEEVAYLAIDLGLAETVETYEPATIAAAEDVASAVAALTATDENADAAAILANAGITPETEVSREQFATVIFAIAEAQGYDVTARADLSEKFTDADAVSAFAQDALEWAVSTGLYQGDDKEQLNPKDTLTYEQLVLIVSRYLALIAAQQ